MSYYSRWGLIIGTSFFQGFLQKSYALGISDLVKLQRNADFSNPGFTCLLCGVGNAATAHSFIQFVLKRNSKAHIIIIDLGNEQISKVKELVKKNYSEYRITLRQMNALDLLSWLKESSLDWIETDGFLEFFTPKQLPPLIRIWYSLLKPQGFVTIRETASYGVLGSTIDISRIWLAKHWLGVQLYRFTLQDLDKIFRSERFKYLVSPTRVPTYQRFTLVKA